MVKKNNTVSHLQLIQGGLYCETSWGPVRIVAGPEHSPPFPVEAAAAEEDTYLVLSAETTISDPKKHIVRIMTQLIDTRPALPGSVLIRSGSPLRFLAIVHDLDQDPTWREAWIISALEEIFRKAEQHKLKSLGLPLLGTLHGSLEKKRFAALLGNALARAAANSLERLWLFAPAGINREIIEALKNELHTC